MRTLLLTLSLLIISPTLFSQSITIGEDGIVRCKDVPIGTTEVIFGETYEVVDRRLLIEKEIGGQNLGTLCVSNVVDMSGILQYEENINGDISNWDVSNVKIMAALFRGSEINQDITKWNVSNVTNMNSMFSQSTFNQDIGNWDVSNVTDMYGMFENTPFNQDISKWDVSSVTDMGLMFRSSRFNRNISNWNVSSVNDMSYMFYSSTFHQDIGNWDVSSVTNMESMFAEMRFDQPVGNWDVSSVTNMESMFYRNVAFKQDISNWDVSSVTDMSNMFNQTYFNQDIGSWDVSSVTRMSGMFWYSEFNQDIGDWDVSSVTDMSNMFNQTNFNQDIGSWDVSSVTDMSGTFNQNKFNQDISGWDVSSVTDMNSMFKGSPSNYDISNWDVSSVTDMENMFYRSEFNQDISNWCVLLILDEQYRFSSSTFFPEYHPKWGNCPEKTPNTPILTYPNDGELNMERIVQFQWEPDSLSTSYRFQVYEGTQSIFIDTLIFTNLFENSLPFESNTTFNWRVRGINQIETPVDTSLFSDWSQFASFTTKLYPPVRITQLIPSNKTDGITTNPILTWLNDTYSDSFHVEVSTDNFDTYIYQESLVDTFITLSGLEYNTTYFWRVRGSNLAGSSEWSEVWSFETEKERPLIVKNSLPKVVTCGSNTLILKDNGLLYGVGNNLWGQLGNGTLSKYRVEEWNQDFRMIDDFIQVKGFPKLIDFTCSMGTIYGIDESMDVWAVGNNSSGQTSVTDSTVLFEPVRMNLDFKVSSISSKTQHLLLLNQDSTTLYSLGKNTYGQLGNDDNVDSHIPQKVFELTEGKIWSISTGGDVSGLLTSNGDLYLWGRNGFIQIKGTNVGSGNLNDKFYSPEFIMSNVKMFEIGQTHTLAIDSTGQLTLWGNHRREGDSGLYNERFYVENIVIDNQTLPELISQGKEVQLRAGDGVTMLVVDNRYLIIWGDDRNGALGNGDQNSTAEKHLIDVLDYTGSKIISIDLTLSHTAILLQNGQLLSWGENAWSKTGHNMKDFVQEDELGSKVFGVQLPTIVDFKSNQPFNIDEVTNSFTPIILDTTVTNNELKIRVKSDEFHKFILSRSTSQDDLMMIASFDSMYQDTSLQSSTNYFYEITSLNNGGVQSPPISLEVKTQSNFYLHENGITVMCPEANVGDVGEINGVLFTKRITDEITIQNASTTCTSGITSFYELFKEKTTFNEDIGHWDVSSVKDMFGMFWGATRFNVDISNWDVSNVTNMAVMFYSAKSFNQDISNWNTGRVENMGSMFSRADSFNQNINTWDVSQVKNLSNMFAYNPTFNQPLSDWATSSLTDIHQIFLFATSFNQNINGWNVSNVTNMQNVFNGAISFNQPLNKWDIRKVVNFGNAFANAESFNQDLSAWKLYSASITNGIFTNSNVKNTNYTKMLNSWANDDSTMIFNTFDINSTFNQDAQAARSKLIEEFKWTINDEGFEPYTNESPNLLTPFDEQINVGKLTEFTWDDLENITTYQVQIAQESQFSIISFDSSGISQPNLTLQVPLDENYKYQWRVRGLHSDSTLNTEWSDTLTFTTGVRTSIEEELIPQEYQLSQNYPNPFNPSTQIQYALPEATQVTLEVFNSLGQKVMELVNGQKSAGYHTATFDASGLSSGVYLYKLTTPSFTQTKKMLLIK